MAERYVLWHHGGAICPLAIGRTVRTRNVGQMISTIVSVYQLAKYKYFALIFSSINAIFYI